MGINWLSNFIVSSTFLTLTKAITKYGTFFIYAGIAIAGFIYLFVKLPETKGLSLEQIDTLFLNEEEKQELIKRKNINETKRIKDEMESFKESTFVM